MCKLDVGLEVALAISGILAFREQAVKLGSAEGRVSHDRIRHWQPNQLTVLAEAIEVWVECQESPFARIRWTIVPFCLILT